MNISFYIDRKVIINVPTYRNPTQYRAFIEEFLQFLCKRIIYRIHEILDKRLYNWVPLSKSYLKYKRKMHLSLRTWVASGQLTNSITYWKNPTGTGFFIGVNPRLYHGVYRRGGVSTVKTKVKLTTILGRLEYGTSRIPARPLFRPVFNEFKKDLPRHYREYLEIVKSSMEGQPISEYHPYTYTGKEVKYEESSPLNSSNIKFRTGQNRKNLRSYGSGRSGSSVSHGGSYTGNTKEKRVVTSNKLVRSTKSVSAVPKTYNRSTHSLQRTRNTLQRVNKSNVYSSPRRVSVSKVVVTNRVQKTPKFYSNLFRFTNKPSLLYNKK